MSPYKPDPSLFPKAGVRSRSGKKALYSNTPKTVRLAARYDQEKSQSPRS